MILASGTLPAAGSWVGAFTSVPAKPDTGICAAAISEEPVGEDEFESGLYEFVWDDNPPRFATVRAEV
jgi:hypothetical protein